jgi:uncharacterized protein YbbC (DUF1343 family)
MSEFFKHHFSLFFIVLLFCACTETQSQRITPAAERSELYLPLLEGKKVGLITNHSAKVGDGHLVDFLLSKQIDVVKIYSSEHGFRGDQADGAKIQDGVDAETGIPLISLYKNSKKPSLEMLAGIDILIFDIQDVGMRFYTFISTMSYAMEAAAENDVKFMVLDRPNPNSYYVDGPVLDSNYASFVGVHSVPIAYGMTVGEYANMVKGEKWINESEKLDLTIIPIGHYTHDSIYSLPIAPSPNLPNMKSILLYPSLCLLEPCNVSIGRGTPFPFQVLGYPDYSEGDFEFTPVSIPGASEHPKFENITCRGIDLRDISNEEIIARGAINWEYLWLMYDELGEDEFFKSLNYFQKLSGSDKIHQALLNGLSIDEFKASYQEELNAFKLIRAKYLLYP